MRYRPEIDGLRAVAVLPVLLFHAGWDFTSGGFVGVDVFFVISGYLITSLILKEKERGAFSLALFYQRRARRILPALFLVMAVSYIFAWQSLVPPDMRAFAKSVIAVTTFWSNFLFLSETGYWGQENELKPLLHTWSLGVEEQFYLLFPLFLTLIWRWGRKKLLPAFATIGFLSFAAAQWAVSHHPDAGFFLLPFRAWELAIGALVAIGFLHPWSVSRGLAAWPSYRRDLAAGIGLLIIGYAVFAFDHNTPFPGLAALLPTVGTALVIGFAGQDTVVGRVLGSKVPVGIGLISYSAYLWHHPLLAFARHRSVAEPSKLLLAIISLLSLPLAYMTWKYVEIPFRARRNGRFSISCRAFLLFAFAAFTVFLGLGVLGVVTNGFDYRRSETGQTWQALQERLKPNEGLGSECAQGLFRSPKCRTSPKPEIVVWGDSFAMPIVQAILAAKPDARLLQITKPVCGPFFDVAPVSRRYPVAWATKCLEFTAAVHSWLVSENTPKFAVLASQFDQYFTAQLLFPDGRLRDGSLPLAVREFSKTILELRRLGLTPVVVSPPPVTGANLGQKLAFAAWRNIPLESCDFPMANVLPRRLQGYRFLAEVSKATQVKVISLEDMLCNGYRCSTHFGDTFLYRDTGHLSLEGSRELGRRFDFYRLVTEGQEGSR